MNNCQDANNSKLSSTINDSLINHLIVQARSTALFIQSYALLPHDRAEHMGRLSRLLHAIQWRQAVISYYNL